MAERPSEYKLDPAAARQITKALKGLTHGSVQIIVQDSKVVQIDRVEKFRLEKAPPATRGSGSGKREH